MKRQDIKRETEEHLAKLGFARSNYVWQPQLAQIIIVIDGNIETLKLKSGMSRRAFSYEMGFIAGLARAAGIKPRAKSNGAHTNPAAWNEPTQLEIPA